MPMDLRDFYQDRRDRLEQQRDDSQSELTAALGDLGSRREAHRHLLGQLAAVIDEIADVRRGLAEAPTPADAEALADTLRDLIIERRGLGAALLDAEQEVEDAEGDVERWRSLLVAAENELSEAEDDLADAEARRAEHDDRVVALGQPPLADLATGASDLLTGAEFSEAAARVEGMDADLPARLRTRSLERRARQLERLQEAGGLHAHAQAQHDAQRKADGGVEGEVDELLTAFVGAETAFGDYVRRAAADLELARLNLERINASAPLSGEQRSLLNDSDLETEREAAADAEKDYTDALRLVEQAQRDLEEARLEARSDDVDRTDAEIDAVPAVAAILTNLSSTLEPDLATQLGAFDTPPAAGEPTPRRVLDLWEAAAPDHIWSNLAAFEEAREILNRLAAGPGTLQADLEAAESALAAALAADDKSERTRAALEAAVAATRRRHDFAGEIQRRRIASEVRGDR